MNPIPFSLDHLVLDSSVVIKWYRQGEILAEQALILREAYLARQVVISVPTLLVYELTNVLRYKNDLNTGQVQEAVHSLFNMNLHIVLPSWPVMELAVELGHTYNITIYDAVFAAMAHTLSAGLITADERLVQSLNDLPFVYFLGEASI